MRFVTASGRPRTLPPAAFGKQGAEDSVGISPVRLQTVKKSAEIRRNPQKHPIKYPYQISQAKNPTGPGGSLIGI